MMDREQPDAHDVPGHGRPGGIDDPVPDAEYGDVQDDSDRPDPQEEDDLPELHVGDHVVDREDDGDGATLVVVGKPLLTAEEIEVDGGTIADYNPERPADDEVIEAVYAGRTDRELSTDGYQFPRSRLRRVAAIHDVGEEGG